MTTFGEISEPVSRTAWEDWDEVTPEQNITGLKWQCTPDPPHSIESFLILEGKYLFDCIRNGRNECLKCINNIPAVNLFLYKYIDSNNLICIIKEYNLLLSSEVVELLRPYLVMSQEVTTLQTKPLPEYQVMEATAQDCVIRMISINQPANKLGFNYRKLEQPNIISGITAGALSLREHLNLSGTALLCYTEHLEEFQAYDFHQLLAKLNIIQHSKSKISSVLDSNLYI